MTEPGREGPRRRYGLDDGIRQRRRVVLVVDDSGMTRMMVSEVVEVLGFESVEAASGEEAIALADYYEPRLIVLDIQMPGVSGLQTLVQMRASPKLARTPVIMLTVESQRQSIQAAIGLGVVDYLIKPVNLGALKARIRKAIGDGD